eukprot:SAG11_NODE_11511_length_756_cov_0.785388_2_plen_216_part_01
MLILRHCHMARTKSPELRVSTCPQRMERTLWTDRGQNRIFLRRSYRTSSKSPTEVAHKSRLFGGTWCSAPPQPRPSTCPLGTERTVWMGPRRHREFPPRTTCSYCRALRPRWYLHRNTLMPRSCCRRRSQVAAGSRRRGKLSSSGLHPRAIRWVGSFRARHRPGPRCRSLLLVLVCIVLSPWSTQHNTSTLLRPYCNIRGFPLQGGRCHTHRNLHP